MKRYNGYIDSVKAEFAERVFSSRKRIIKFIAICFVSFLYAFICIWAFWDPIPKIGLAPIAIVSNDVPINFVIGKTSDKKLVVGQAYSYKNNLGDIVVIDDSTDINGLDNGTEIITSAGTIIIKDTGMIYSKISLVDSLINSWKTNNFENIKYDKNSDKFTVKINDNMTLKNLKFLNGENAKQIARQKTDGSWDVRDENKYWAQIQMPIDLTSNFIGYFDASLQKLFHLPSDPNSAKAPNEFLENLKRNNMQFWSTYKHNFLFGQFMYIFDEFKSSLLVDLGPQIISSLIPLIFQNMINNAKDQFIFTAPKSTSEKVMILDHGSLIDHPVTFMVDKGETYVIRNQEMIDAIKNIHPDWTLSRLSIEGTTGTDIKQDWKTNGFLNIFAEYWNNLMQGNYGNLLASSLANLLTKKINDSLPANLGSLTIDANGIKKLFSTPGNIAGLLELNGNIIPESEANFSITGTGVVGASIKNYKNLVTYSTKIFESKFNLINILSADSKTNESAYVLPFGTLIEPKIGTFNYNLQHNINAIASIIGKANIYGVLGEFLPDINDFIKTTIVGSKFNFYGIGLGQFFLCIGLWVGTVMQTFVFDRAKRVKKAKPWAWYLSKTTLMLVTAWIQTTILMLSIYFLGWLIIGVSFGLMYLWMMFTVTIFVVIQQALWFSVQDETVGKFLIIILLIINLSSGWGTFPTFMQSPIFNFLSYFAPYTYSIHGQGAIIYSVAIKGTNLVDTFYILQQFGILLIWGFVFLLIGLFSSVQRNRDIFYGTHKSKKLAVILLSEKMDKYVNFKSKKVIWKKLPKKEMIEISKKVKECYPEEKKYKWFQKWKAKNNSKSLTASESDDEIIKRNN